MKVYLSYSQSDKEWADRLRTHLDTLEYSGEIDLWDARNVNIEAFTRDEITQALNSAQIVILLLSPDFLSSDLINTELSEILQKLRSKEIKLIPIVINYVTPKLLGEIENYKPININYPLMTLSFEEAEKKLEEATTNS
ncbi:MAG: hypothetical protein ETSY2_32325 [Candidatus Entotheonella gemina]|uniref:TIR domain-containing protein n=1 Tax=Candidatus Entotheonella gemina TaxID=1429439 RepID=W4M0J5_9BACT|nr:MAG: hypothetical protein ETSY2_32325 [Candidatus Entotheonella gemina]